MTVRIRRKLESESPYLPELRSLIGKNVEIIVFEDPPTAIKPGTGDWGAAMKAVAELDNYDFEACRKQRETDLEHARDHLP